MVEIHTVGWKKHVYDSTLREQAQKTMFCTFEERFDQLIDLLKYSKRTCIDVLKTERFYTAIGNPWELNTRSSSNMESNYTKGNILKTYPPSGVKRARGEMEGEGGEEAQAVTGPRPKKARRSARK